MRPSAVVSVILAGVIACVALASLTTGHEADGPVGPAAKLTSLIKLLKMEDCAARVVCELSCRPAFFGGEGKRVLKTLVRIQTSGDVVREDMRFYLNAGLTGRRARVSRDCSKCDSTYDQCAASAADLIDIFSMIRVDL